MAASSPNPYVELLYSDLHPSAFRQVEEKLGDPSDRITAALGTYRLLVVNNVKDEIRKKSSVTGKELLRLADLAAELYLGRFVSLIGPTATTAYIAAFVAADNGNGDVPMDLVYALANQHAERMGRYFHMTSKESMTQGFNRLVNKGVPERVAAERVMDAFGLTPRQMSGYVALEASSKAHTSVPKNMKAKAQAYIGRSIRRRFKIFGDQEAHNLTQQGQQVAWMWLRDKGKLSELAEKVWLTAKDERVCKICGPMHGKRVGLAERFKMPDGSDLYVPGAHVNCRCTVKLVDLMSLVQKADFQEVEHPRAVDGKFKEKPDTRSFQAFLDNVETEEPKISMSRDKPISMGSVSLRPVSMPKISMSPKAQEKVDLALKPKTVSMPTQLGIKMKLSTARVAMQLMAKEPPPKKSREVAYRETVKLEKPVYAVIDNWMMDMHGVVELTGEEEFYTDRSKVALDAATAYHEGIENAVQSVMEEGLDTLENQDAGGNQVYANLEMEDLYNVAAAVASNEVADLNQNHVKIEWKDHMNHPVGQPDYLSWGEIANEFGWTQEDFKVYILRVEEGHNGSRGSTSARGINDQYELSGNYNVIFAGRDQVGHSADITMLQGEPDAPSERFGDNPDD